MYHGWTEEFLDTNGDNTAQAIKTSDGWLGYLHVANSNTSAAYLQLFDAATSDVTVGTTTPIQSYFIPPNGGWESPWEEPMRFDHAITYACTTEPTGSGAPTTGLLVNARYS